MRPHARLPSQREFRGLYPPAQAWVNEAEVNIDQAASWTDGS